MDTAPTSFAFVDLETSGGNALHDRVIEIAVLLMDDGVVTRTWSTLVDPERSISPFITGITGITDGDVAHAPTFRSIADELQELLANRVFVAHNARFDYGFLKNEFKRLDVSWSAKTLCTVRLSRALYPRRRSHNLDSIIRDHGLECENRHRALDDAKVMTEFWFKAREERGSESFDWCVQSLLKHPALPSYVSSSSVHRLPDETGVYLFYGKGERPIYIGKSVNVRSRVLSHFSGDHSLSKDLKLSSQLRRVEYRETIGELGALLLESKLVKEHLPVYNVQLRRTSRRCAIRLIEGNDGFDTVAFAVGSDIRPEEFSSLFGVFRTEQMARLHLENLAEAYSLCPRRLGLEKGTTGACFSYHLKKCKGACCGEDPADEHNARVRMALSSMKHREWPFRGKIGIRETDIITERTEIHVIDNWCYLGTCRNDDELQALLAGETPSHFDLDSYRIVASFLKRSRGRPTKKGGVSVEVVDLAPPDSPRKADVTRALRRKKKAVLSQLTKRRSSVR